MVHDPMVLEPTPWELLELAPDLWRTAGGERPFRTAVDHAYTQALKRRVPPQKAKVARDTLLRPTGRARVDILSYPEDAFARLAGARGTGALELAARGETAALWEAHFAAHPDDLASAHCLLVLWWAWVQREEDLRLAANRFAPPELHDMWCDLIAFAGLFAAAPAYVMARSGLSREDATQVLDALVLSLKDRLMDRAQAAGRTLEGRRYRLLEQFLADEVQTARALAAARVKVCGVDFAAGPRLLSRLGLAGEVRARGLPPGVSLSPYACLERQARSGHPDEALEALSVLPQHEQNSHAADAMRAVAYATMALALVAQGKLEKALATWGRAAPGTLPPGTEADIVRIVSARFAELVKAHQERPAMDLLVRALRVLPESAALKSLVSAEQHRRTLASVQRIRARVETKHTNLTDMSALSGLIEQLEQSVALGFDEAREPLEWARVAVEAHSLAGELNRQAHARLERELERWGARAFRAKALATLAELVGEFQTAARMGSRKARANVEQVERMLARAKAKPEEMAGLVLVEMHRLEAERGGPHGLTDGDLPLLEALLFDLEGAVALGRNDAIGAAVQPKAQVVALLTARAEKALAEGLTRPLAEPGGPRAVTDTRELKTLLAVHADLKRVLALEPDRAEARRTFADVHACLERANALGGARADAGAPAFERMLRVPLAAMLIVVAVILFLLWLIRSACEELFSVHR